MANTYPLGRSVSASLRLYMQHWMWQSEIGYLLHPRIPVDPTSKDLRIADVGCGSGVWLVQLAKELPDATLEGFDVSKTQFPHPNWLPRNVRLSERDAFAEIPDELVGKFDIVHAGIVVLLVKDGNPDFLLNQLLRMLKPGGFLQWNELDVDNIPRVPASPDVPRANCDALYDKIVEIVQKMGVHTDVSWVERLGQIVELHPDLRSVANERYDVSDSFAHASSISHLASVSEVIHQLPDATVKENNLWELYEAAAGELQAGLSIKPSHVVVVGQKILRSA